MRAVARAVCSVFNGTVVGLVLVCAVALTPKLAGAQDTPSVEIGTSAGVTIVSAFGSSDTHVGIPGGVGPLTTFSPIMYATIFATPSVIVEPQISVSSTSSSGSTLTFLTLVGQVGYLFKTAGTSSPYLAASGAFQRVSGGGSSASGPGIGAEVGYRFVVKSALGVRVNGRYRRWFSDFSDTNEIGFGVALGAIL